MYLETSFVSACVTTRQDPLNRHRRWSSLSWWHGHARSHELFISGMVLRELAHPGFRSRVPALEFVGGLPVLETTSGAERIAAFLIAEKAMPRPVLGDALHAAIAIWHDIDTLLSWDVRHLANPRKVVHLERLCARLGRRMPRIVTPDHVISR